MASPTTLAPADGPTLDTCGGTAGCERHVDELGDRVGRQVRALHALKTRLARGESEVERAMHVALFVLADSGPQRVSALAERLGTDPSTTSRQAGELIRRGLLTKLPDPEDRRAGLLSVTPAGHEVVATMKVHRHGHLARATASFDHDELLAFIDLLGRFAEGLEEASHACPVPAAPAPDTAEENA